MGGGQKSTGGFALPQVLLGNANMKTAIVTGASRGIGAEIAKQLEAKGYEVHRLTARVDYPLNIGDSFENWPRLDVLVNNAAIMPENKGILETTEAVIEGCLQTNALGAWRVTQAFWPMLKGGGRVVNVSSTDGVLSRMDGNRAAYAISKAALNAITVQLAIVGQNNGVIVNACCPGWCRTDMGGPNAPRSAAEGADTPVWLATEAPSNLTGMFFMDRKEIAL
jgi:NAD(P)-dependent dehydrogenase (short-subunit alcohol dehydrogenase family)